MWKPSSGAAAAVTGAAAVAAVTGVAVAVGASGVAVALAVLAAFSAGNRNHAAGLSVAQDACSIPVQLVCIGWGFLVGTSQRED